MVHVNTRITTNHLQTWGDGSRSQPIVCSWSFYPNSGQLLTIDRAHDRESPLGIHWLLCSVANRTCWKTQLTAICESDGYAVLWRRILSEHRRREHKRVWTGRRGLTETEKVEAASSAAGVEKLSTEKKYSGEVRFIAHIRLSFGLHTDLWLLCDEQKW